MQHQVRSINPHISVDCVVFGFDTLRLKVLLIEREYIGAHGKKIMDYKLPGDFINPREDLDRAAHRTLNELTGLQDIYLRQFAVFGDPGRISRREDLKWLADTTGMDIRRVVTTAYYALISIPESNSDPVIKNNARWTCLEQVPELAFDHMKILKRGHEHLQITLRNEPIGFKLLPEKFTIRELQSLYEVILGCRLDNRNFRKKVLKSRYLVPLAEKQSGVAHKPARFYRFDKHKYNNHKKEALGFNF